MLSSILCVQSKFSPLYCYFNLTSAPSEFRLLGRDLELWEHPSTDPFRSHSLNIQELTFHTLTPTDFQPRPYSPPLTDVDDVLPSRPVSPWQPIQQPLRAQQGADAVALTQETVDQIEIDTTYDRNHTENRRSQVPKDANENREWTDRERTGAANAEFVRDQQDLADKLEVFYPGGAKRSSRPYLGVCTTSFPKYVHLCKKYNYLLIYHSSRIKIYDKDKSLQTFISTTLPAAVRSVLHANLYACLSEIAKLEDAHSKAFSKETPKFVAIHCSWYNRHAMRVSSVVLFAVV